MLETDGGGPWGSDKQDGSTPGTGGGGNDGGGGLGPRNPWTEPPVPRKPGRGRPALSMGALDELMRRGRARFGGRLPEPRDRSFWLWGIVSLIGLWLIVTSLHRIDPGERGVVTRFGRFEAVLDPGLRLTLPAPVDQVVKLPVEPAGAVEIGNASGDTPALDITGDGSLVDLAYSVQWKVRDPALFLFGIDPNEAPEVIRRAAEVGMRGEISHMSLADVLGTQRGLLEQRAAQRTQALLDQDHSGVQIVGITLRKAQLPAALADTAKEVINAAEARRTKLQEARSYAAGKATAAQAEADAFNKVYDDYKLSPDMTRHRMYYDMMDEVLPKLDKTIIDVPGTTPTLPILLNHRSTAGGQP